MLHPHGREHIRQRWAELLVFTPGLTKLHRHRGGGHDEFLMRGSDFGGGEGVRKDQNGLVWLIFVFRVICHLSLCWYFVFLGLFYEFHEL